MAALDELVKLAFEQEDMQRCYYQLAALADNACRHRSTKYFYKWGCKHHGREKEIAKLVNDEMSTMANRKPLMYPAMPKPGVGSAALAASADMLQFFDAAYSMEKQLIPKLEAVAAAARSEKKTPIVDLMHGFTKETSRQVAHLYRKVEMLKEAGKDPAALQSFDHRLM